MEVLGSGWTYISEGNVHIVVQLTNSEFVLRFIKEDAKAIPFEDVQNAVKFVNHVMTPILRCKSNYHEIIKVPREELSLLSHDLFKWRPKHRRFKSKLSPFAIKTLNLALLNKSCPTNYCVEIKPKEGFLTSSVKSLSRCYYCLNQYLKLEQGKIKNKSDYCPLDLFSNEKKHMKIALMNLIHNPQNNFKIFKDGNLLFDENSRFGDIENVVKDMNAFNNINIFIDFLVKTLMSGEENFAIEMTETLEVPNKSPKDKCLENALHECHNKNKSILNKLLQIQKLSNSLDIDLSNIGQGKEYVQEIIDHIQKKNLDLNVEVDRETFIKTANPLHLAMISAVAKDCSIMISFSPDFVGNHSYISINNKKISYRVSITDLEPKNIESLLRRKNTESKIIEIYTKSVSKEDNM